MNYFSVSVLITCYNSEKYILETLNSVLNQDFLDYEIVIVNDGSTDNTDYIIKDFILSHRYTHFVNYISLPVNNGIQNLNNVINIGLMACRGKYICRIDSDDLMLPNRLFYQFNYLEKHKDVFLVGSSAEVVDSSGNTIDFIKKRSYPCFLYKYRLSSSNPFIHSSIMFRNEGFLYPSYIEHYFYLSLSIAGKKLKNLSPVLVKYRINPTGVISKTDLSSNKYKSFYLQNV